MKNNFVEMWDSWSKRRANGKPIYDNWLDNYEAILDKKETILDLGCGIGSDTLYLLEKGYQVLSCDFSTEALKAVEKNIVGSKTQYLDLSEPFPFDDSSFKTIIADLCLHYFDNNTTIHIMKEIKRILEEDGVLLSRVASTNDAYYGAGQGEKLEENFYFEGDYNKRFYNIDDAIKYFSIIGDVDIKETSMVRDEEEYKNPKQLLEIKVRRTNNGI